MRDGNESESRTSYPFRIKSLFSQNVEIATGFYRVYEDPNLRPGDLTLKESVGIFMKLWDSADLSDEAQRVTISEESKAAFRNHEVVRLPKSVGEARAGVAEEASS